LKSSKTVFLVLVLLFFCIVAAPNLLNAQSLTQGDIRGTVTDPTGAVVPGATVTLHNDDTGQTLTHTSSPTGAYEFAFLSPGHYTITIAAPNYQKTTRTTAATVGQVTTVNVQLPVYAASQTVTVTAEGGVIQTQSPSLSTTMSSEQIALVPNGGGDLSYIAQTAPGSVMNSQGGYGNFSSNGLPANTNNFTVNSMPENDPFLNLNNSGATNILLGQNDVQEATVVSNGYSGEYSMAGANVNYVSRGGTNKYHGNAIWRWNGRSLNANNYFNKQNDPPTPRGFVNDNQWAASFGGPIRKDKTFFFVDTEGLYLIVPVSRSVNVPTTAFENATLANLATANPSETTLYQNMFNIYNSAPGASSAGNTLANGGCADFTGAGFGAANPCALRYNSTVSGQTHEWLVTGRVDQNVGNNDKAFVHFRMDRGVQATYTDPLNPTFNLDSFQPQYEGQLQEVHTFSPTTVNSFNLSGSYYRAIFQQTNPAAALALQPMEVSFTGNALFPLGRDYTIPNPTPQGRNVTQYGFVDDLSHTMGNHTIKVGANLARFDITTYGPGIGSLPLVSNETMTAFFNGVGSNFSQAFPERLTQPLSLYNLGFYGQDTWHARQNLTLTLAFRFDRNSNPACNTNCFNRLVSSFNSVDHSVTDPYNTTILANQSNALPSSYHPWTFEPRFGFNWSPFANAGLVLSGGFGIFGSTMPAGFTDSLINNLPGDPAFTVSGLAYAPGVPGNAQSATAAAAVALRNGFVNGANYNDLNNAVMAATGGLTGFSVPNFFNVANDIHSPRFQEWDLQVEKAIGNKMSLNLKYVGNHGIWEQIANNGLNAYCGTTNPVTASAGTTPCLSTATTPGALPFTSFNGLPTSPTDPRFLDMTEISSGYNSNYNGLTVSFLRRFSAFQFQLNYTWSHALDYVSNAGQGITPFNFDTNLSITNPQNPFNVYQNMYGNADYDIRHYFSANYVYTTPKNMFQGFLGKLAGDWTIAGTIFARTGLPFTVVDTGTGGALAAYGYGGATLFGATFADQTGAATGISCGSQYANPGNGACPGLTSNFAADTVGFGNQRRNQVYGPRFFDTDLTLSKAIPIPGWESGRLVFGVTAYNLFNHPNFDQPVGDVASSSFGAIQAAVNAPTSIYGSFLGADASPRLLQTQLKLTF
jgi:hypothetical protein